MIKKKMEDKQDTAKKVASLKKDYILTVGRRKRAVARVRLYPKGSGSVVVNAKPAQEYFKGPASKVAYEMPFTITNTVGRFDVTVKVEGGGPSGQLGAVVHGIARAIVKLDKEKYRLILKKNGLLTRDSRVKERRKAGFAQKARAKKQSPKR